VFTTEKAILLKLFLRFHENLALIANINKDLGIIRDNVQNELNWSTMASGVRAGGQL